MKLKTEDYLKVVTKLEELEAVLQRDLVSVKQSECPRIVTLYEVALTERPIDKFLRECKKEEIIILHSVVSMGRDFVERVEERPRRSCSKEMYSKELERILNKNREEFVYPYLFDKEEKWVLYYINEARYQLNNLRYAV